MASSSIARTGIARLRGAYYGWYVVGACNLVAFMTWGVGVFNQGVFLGFFADRFGWPESSLSVAPALFYVWAGVMGIAVGRSVDRWGPRPVLILGAVFLSGGALALGSTRALWQLYPAFLLLSTGYALLHTVTLGAIVARWFVRDRARAMAMAMVGASVGGMVLAPANAAVLERWGAPAGGALLALIVCAVVVPLAVWVMKDGPASLEPPVSGTRQPTAPMSDGGFAARAPIRAAMRSGAFWAILVSFHLVMIAQAGFLIHQVLFLRPSFGLVGAAWVVTLTAVMGVVGRIGLMVAGDRWPLRRVAAVVFVIQAAGLLLSAASDSHATLIAGSMAFGLTTGISIALQPAITAECLGTRAFGRVYGSIYLAIQQGSAIGPLLLGGLAALAGTYRPGLLVVSGGLLIAAVCIRWARPPAAQPA